MPRPVDRHLELTEIELLIRAGRGVAHPSQGPEALTDELRGIREHLDLCSACREQVQVHAAAEELLAAPTRAERETSGPECPPTHIWARLAGGLMDLEDSEKYLNHAVECSHCGQLLLAVTKEFSDDLLAEERERLAGLESAKPEWAREFAKKLAAAGTQKPAPAAPEALWRVPRAKASVKWARYAVPAVAILIIGIAYWQWLQPRATRAEELLARAYKAQRTLELRIPVAEPAPLRLERGEAASRMSRPPQLLEAEAMIARELASKPNAEAWLAAKGRADLLEWQSEDAIAVLQRALELRPDNSEAQIDLATAYCERAEASQRQQDYETAIKLLSDVLQRTPDDSVARFNRAIVYGRMSRDEDAIQDWEQFLKQNPSSAWEGEARQRLDTLQKKGSPVR